MKNLVSNELRKVKFPPLKDKDNVSSVSPLRAVKTSASLPFYSGNFTLINLFSLKV